MGDDPSPLALPREIDSVDYANSLEKTPHDFALRIPVPLHHVLLEVKVVAYSPAGGSRVSVLRVAILVLWREDEIPLAVAGEEDFQRGDKVSSRRPLGDPQRRQFLPGKD